MSYRGSQEIDENYFIKKYRKTRELMDWECYRRGYS